MVTVYYAPNARSLRVLWALEELGAPYEASKVLFPARQRQPEYLKINPVGSIPAMVDGAVTLTESLAICEYLDAKQGGGLSVPLGDLAHWDYVQWMYFGEASLSPPLGNLVRLSRVEQKDAGLEAFQANVCEAFAHRAAALEDRLDGREYLVADRFTLADISNGYALNLAGLVGQAEVLGPRTTAYFGRLKARPAFQRAAAHA